MSLENDLAKSMMTDVHSASKTITPDNPIPLDDFMEEISKLDFYTHGAARGDGWSSVAVYGVEKDYTDHPSKYGITDPVFKWCLEEEAPIITDYFKNGKFFKGMEFKRIRIMRLDPAGLIRAHSDQDNNSLLNAINIELGPKPAQFSMIALTKRMGLDNYPGRTYLFNNHYVHMVTNPHDQYRYQIIVHAKNMREMMGDFIRSNEKFIRGVWTDDEERDYFAFWTASGKNKGSGLESVPYVRPTLLDLCDIARETGKKGYFINGNVRNQVFLHEGTKSRKQTHIYEAFKIWEKENLPTIVEDDFVFFNPKSPTEIPLKYSLFMSNRGFNEIRHQPLNLQTQQYWTYTTDAAIDYESPHHKNRDFDLVASVGSGTFHEFLMSSFNVKNALVFDECENNLHIFEKIRTYMKEQDVKGWEVFEKYTRKCCDEYRVACKGVPSVKHTGQTIKFLMHMSPFEFEYLIKRAHYEYLLFDIVANPEKLLPYVAGQRLVLNTSNIFPYINEVQKKTYKEICDGWERLMEVLRHTEYTYFIGEDPLKVNKRFWVYGDK